MTPSWKGVYPAATTAFAKDPSVDLEEARALNRWFAPLLHLDTHPKLVQYIKLTMVETGMGTEEVRLPRMKIVGEERERILGIIRTAIKNRPALK